MGQKIKLYASRTTHYQKRNEMSSSTSTSPKKIPVNIIGGTLGVGKTTTINHLLKHKPPNEKWAILVNEYGLVGLDSALLTPVSEQEESGGVQIKEVAGGCICCSAGFMFEVSLVQLLQRRPDRLLIEPTGLAALSGIIETLERKGIIEAVDIRSILCLLDPTKLKSALERKETLDQIDSADIILASRSDLATPQQLNEFYSWADSLFPKKKVVAQIEQGCISTELLDLVSQRQIPVPTKGHKHGTDHHHDEHHHGEHHHGEHHHDEHHHDEHHHDEHHHDEHHHDEHHHAKEQHCSETHPIVNRTHISPIASTVGWICWNGLVFDAEKVSDWLNRITQVPDAIRTKAVLRTNEGWWSFNFVDRKEELRPNGYRRDSRIELIIEGENVPDVKLLEQELQKCVVHPSI